MNARSDIKESRRMKTMIAGIGLIIVSNAIVLAGVSYNRSGEPESTITLTERELSLPYRYLEKEENSGIHLRLAHRSLNNGYFNRDYQPAGNLNWFNKEKLAELGFDVSQPIIGDDNKRYYQRLREKEVILVLEFNGAAYQSVLDAVQKNLDDMLANAPPDIEDRLQGSTLNRAENNLKREKNSTSRLFVIDAGLDRNALRAKYTDRSKYLLMKGLVKARIKNDRSSGPRFVGYIKSLSNKNVHVPLQYHEVLEEIVAEGAGHNQNDSPRFEAIIKVGQRLEPWLVDVTNIFPRGLNVE